MRDFWDQRYADESYAYGTDPNRFFAQSLAALPPGRILLAAEGEGRNAVHAALRGWEVLAYDFSESGRSKALRLAEQHKTRIRYDLRTHEDAEYPDQSVDVLALIFAHVHQDQRRALHRRLSAALVPGGVLIFEAFSKEQLGRGSGGPPQAEMLYSADELRKDFSDLDIEQLDQLEVDLAEGEHHQGRASVIRILARRPLT